MKFSIKEMLSNTFSNNIEKGAKSAVGIDVGDSSIKVVQLDLTERALMLRTYGELQVGPYAGKDMGQTATLESKKLVEALTDVLRESGVTATKGTLAMPLSSSFMTVVPITAKADEDISSRIPVEAKKYVPLPLKEVSLDWSELPSVSGSEGIREVMLVAIENQALSRYRGVLSTVNMTNEPVEVEAFSLIRSLWKDSDTTLAIMDMGAYSSKLYIVRNGTMERIHRIIGGGADVTRRVSELLNVSFEQAEVLKRNYDRNTEQGRDIHKTLSSVVDGQLDEFKRLNARYESRLGEQLGRVVFTGGVSASPGFASYASDVMGREVEIGNPFSKVAYPAFMEDALKDVSPTFAVSLGAALRQIKL